MPERSAARTALVRFLPVPVRVTLRRSLDGARRRVSASALGEARRRARHDDLQYVFVLTYGRSGSTLMMGILNSIPGWCLHGENRHALRGLYDYHRTLVIEQDRVPLHEAQQVTHPWFGIDRYDRAASFAAARRLVLDSMLRPAKDVRVTGFKEIRWYDADVADYVAWVREVFPGARFVVNTRNLGDVARSGWWRDDPDAAATLADIETRMLALADSLGDAAYRVHYDDYKGNPEALRGLFEWLGEEFDAERLEQVMSTDHSVMNRTR
ncbi:sulfotransferase [Nocardioides yefusunii]|uniref:Sulfotransferase n=1 Tax=Nocardioides yefusunii TaxID=2500546 RepID=A0ABW1QRU7_9ACTN|nr:sulfotransferase [Nocardioides yefusunii]